MYRANVTIIGAGVIGLAIAAEVASQTKDVYVLEKNETFGMEVSSRHSGVIHSGIYYPEGSLKAEMCVAGNRILHKLCADYGIAGRALGKLIVATNDAEVAELQELLEKGLKNGVEDLRLLSKRQMKELEPNVAGVAAILSPSTGIIDAHMLMRYFIARAKAGGANIVYRTKVVGIERTAGSYRVTVADDTGRFAIATRILINCAGLYCDKVAEMAGIDTDRAGYRLHYCKGEYFHINGHKRNLVKRLVYPVPPPNLTGVGIHLTLDLEGKMRLGPSIHYTDSIDYSIDSRHKKLFYDSARRFLPFLEYCDIEPEMAGIRPKIQAAGEDIKDFVIKDESDRGLPGFIELIGIESPGLTAAPAIAKHVSRLIG